jgi:hypothetical protein
MTPPASSEDAGGVRVLVSSYQGGPDHAIRGLMKRLSGVANS